MSSVKISQVMAFVIAVSVAITLVSAVRADVHTTAPVLSSKAYTPPERTSFYLSGLFVSGVLVEDSDNRLTDRDSRQRFAPGLALRAGAVLDRHHMFGGLFQSAWHVTRSVLDSQGDDDKLGALSAYFVGPEYRYLFDEGVYASVSTGLSFTMADNDLDGGGSVDCDSAECLEDHFEQSDDHAAFGLGFRGAVGYEYRFHRYLAVNGEVFASLLIGEDEYEHTMSTATYGLAIGVGI